MKKKGRGKSWRKKKKTRRTWQRVEGWKEGEEKERFSPSNISVEKKLARFKRSVWRRGHKRRRRGQPELSVTGTTVGRNRGPAVLPLPSNSPAAAFGSESESRLLLLDRDLSTILVSQFGDHLLALGPLNL